MLTGSNFNKSPVESARIERHTVKLTPKEPIPGLDDLEILVFTTGFSRNGMPIWGWRWSGGNGLFYSSLKQDGRPEQEYFNIESAASAAIKNASYWSDEERIPREENEKTTTRPKEGNARQTSAKILGIRIVNVLVISTDN